MQGASSAPVTDCDLTRVRALLHRIGGFDDGSLQRAAFIVYEALSSIDQAFEVETVEPLPGMVRIVVHPSPALRRIVDALERASRGCQ